VLRSSEDVSRSKRMHIATFCVVFGTVFHHALAAALAVRPISISMIEASVLAPLMAEPALPEASHPRLVATPSGAVPVSSVAAPADEERLATRRRRADCESEKCHVPDGGTGENLVREAGSCDSRDTTHVPVVEGSVLEHRAFIFGVPRCRSFLDERNTAKLPPKTQ